MADIKTLPIEVAAPKRKKINLKRSQKNLLTAIMTVFAALIFSYIY